MKCTLLHTIPYILHYMLYSLIFIYIQEGSDRTANLIALPEHRLWTINNSGDLADFLGTIFPQLRPVTQYFSEQVYMCV